MIQVENPSNQNPNTRDSKNILRRFSRVFIIGGLAAAAVGVVGTVDAKTDIDQSRINKLQEIDDAKIALLTPADKEFLAQIERDGSSNAKNIDYAKSAGIDVNDVLAVWQNEVEITDIRHSNLAEGITTTCLAILGILAVGTGTYHEFQKRKSLNSQ